MTDPDAWQRSIDDQATRFTLDWNARRLAILDRDIDAIITTHLRDGSVAAWHQDVAQALAEADQGELAIEWAKKGADFDHGHQSVSAAHYWCQLLAEHHPDQELAARQDVFHRWPTAAHAADLRRTAGDQWPLYRDAVMGAFPQQDGGRQAVSFALYSLGDVDEAWRLAQRSDLGDSRLWSDLADAYEAIDPVAVLPVHTRLVAHELAVADAAAYRRAAIRLARMRILAAGSGQAGDVEAFIAELRDTHRRRPRLQREFDRAGLP